jgi:DNA polymerase-3 subunit gamma/tau
MPYQALARKHRPQTFDEIVGQEAVSKTLKNSIESNRLAHAYVFFGPRGVGKTTAARVLAKALNCKKGPTTEPCGKCDACVEIAEGRSLDVLEIDAATHTQVDKVREVIIETVAFAPSRDAKKIFIIDEAHMLTNSAFNALLKTLEEPPPHVVFMMATTEPHKIPATIFSRCQRFRFSLVPLPIVKEHLSKLAKKEKVHVSAAALELLAKAGGGSIRDSVSLLDQAVSFAGAKIEAEQVADLLGLLPSETVLGALKAVMGRDPKELWKRIEEVMAMGYEPSQLLKDLRDALQELYLSRLGVQEADPALKALAPASVDAEAFGRLLRKVQKALEEMRYTDSPRVTLELGMFGLIEEPFDLGEWIGKLESLEKKLGGEIGDRHLIPQPTHASSPKPTPSPAPSPKPAPAPTEKKAAAKPESEAEDEAESNDEFWPQVLTKVRAEKPVLGNYLAEAQAAVGPKSLKLTLPSEFKKNGVQRELAYLAGVVEKAAGRSLEISVAVDASLGSATIEDKRGAVPSTTAVDAMPWQDVVSGDDEIIQDPAVKEALKIFPGKVRKPKPE